MGAVLLDTSVLIDHLRGRIVTRDRLRSIRARGDDAFVCAVSVEEVTRGIRPTEDDAFVELLDGLLVAPLGIPEGRLAGFWRRSFARRGRTLSQADALVAAAAAGIGARLATGNPKDFPMRGLEVEHWPVGR
ncbi:MAG TPA: PIN domain-containing protein [Actinomycetota bacterium]|nr:PIN domain-containing protein [Actinomycetota bacterium]